MREPALSQKTRFILLLIEFLILCAASWVVFGQAFPPNGNKGFWFYTALLGLLLGSRLDTPFFAKPSDVFLYAAPAVIALALVNAWEEWNKGIQVGYCLAMTYCIGVGLLGAIAILLVDSPREHWQRTSNSARVLAETLGAPRAIYSVVILFALFAFNATSSKEFGVIMTAWVFTGVLSPLEASFHIIHRLKLIFTPNARFVADGEVVAYQTPGLILVRLSKGATIASGDVIGIRDSLGDSRLALALDYVGRDEGILLRTIEIEDVRVPADICHQLAAFYRNSVISICSDDEVLTAQRLVKERKLLVGLVAPDTSIERLFFEVVKDGDLEEGRLVEVQIGKKNVTYQLVNGLTKEEIVQQKNTHGFARAQAQKIGEWDSTRQRFNLVKWLPAANAPVFLKDASSFEPTTDAVGHFPDTNYPVSVKNVNDLVTHNTAILGILGIGKSMLAIELVERMISAGIKVICIDLTNQYATELAPFINAEKAASDLAALQAIGPDGKAQSNQNVEDGGSRTAFATALGVKISEFIDPANKDWLMTFNPANYEVWRQDSKFFSGKASMASLSPAEITHLIAQATLEAASNYGMTDKARVCLVFEEAHSLVPEWNSAVADGDRTASNGTARAILQGRKYGLGCLLISQRTANVTKTILNQCNTIFAMRTFDDTGKAFMANYIGEAYANSLSSLSERQAVFYGKASSCENPILIQLNDRADFIRVFRAEHPLPV
jgi:uncharacterized protein